MPGERTLEQRADLTVRVDDVGAAAAVAARAVQARDGLVFGEESSSADGSGASSTLTLRVPSAGYSPLLADLDRLGERLSRTQSTTDRTSEVVDVQSRMSSQRASVARVRALLDRAGSIAQVVQVEGELARRQADLEALQAQQERLADLTALATVVLTLVGPDSTAPGDGDEDRPAGFLGGLDAGWTALVAVGTYALTALGALLPAAAVVALLLLVVRRTGVAARLRSVAARRP